MFRVIDRYIGKSVIVMISILCLAFFALLFLSQLMIETQDIGVREYGILQALIHVPMVTIGFLYHCFPIIAFLGSLLSLGHLASTQELLILRVSGMSLRGIVSSVLKVGVLLVALVTLVGEGAVPKIEQFAKVTKARQVSGGQALQTEAGMWVRSGHGFTHIDSVVSEEQLIGVTHYQFDENNQLLWSAFAPVAENRIDHWILKEVQVSDLQSDPIIARSFLERPLNMYLPAKALLLTKVAPSQQWLSELYQGIQFARYHELDSSRLALNFWQRICQPISTLLLLILAIPFVFGPLRSSTTGLRWLLGSLLGFLFYVLDRFFGPFVIVYQVPPIVAAILPLALYSVLFISLLIPKRYWVRGIVDRT